MPAVKGRPFKSSEEARTAALKRWSMPQTAAKRAIEPTNGPAPEPAQMPDKYAVANLRRVRKQLDGLFDDLDGAIAGTTVESDSKGRVHIINPAGIDRLCAAIARVSELERQWAGRSLPPTIRANDRSRSNRRPGAAPIAQVSTPPVANCGAQPKITPPAITPPVQGPENG